MSFNFPRVDVSFCSRSVWNAVKHDYHPFIVAFERKKNKKKHQFEKQLHSQKKKISFTFISFFFPKKIFFIYLS